MAEVLDSPEAYYNKVLKPQYDDFSSSEPEFDKLFGAVNALYHFHEWLYRCRRPALEGHFATVLPSPGTFWKHVEAVDSRFGYIRDLANASKHVSIDRNPSTGMTDSDKASIHRGAFSRGFSNGFDISRTTLKDGDNDIDFDDCADALFAFWTDLLRRTANPDE